jgi:hypothetical protein
VTILGRNQNPKPSHFLKADRHSSSKEFKVRRAIYDYRIGHSTKGVESRIHEDRELRQHLAREVEIGFSISGPRMALPLGLWRTDFGIGP